MYATSDKSIGKVLTTLTVTNRADQSAAARGFIPTEQIHSITLDHVLVDRGATTLCLRCCCDRHSIQNSTANRDRPFFLFLNSRAIALLE